MENLGNWRLSTIHSQRPLRPGVIAANSWSEKI